MSVVWKPSVTVASVIEQDGKFLLVEEETTEGPRLNQPAGHLEPNETPAQGAIREALEETAYTVELEAFLGVYLSRYVSARTRQDVTYLRLAFVGKPISHDPTLKLDAGIVGTFWLTAEELRNSQERHRSPLVWQCVDDYLSGRRLGLDTVFSHSAVVDGVNGGS